MVLPPGSGLPTNRPVSFIFQAQRFFKLMNTGELADKHGEIEVSPRLAKELELVQREMARLGKRIFKN